MEVMTAASTEVLTLAIEYPAGFAAFESEPDVAGRMERRPAKKQTAPNTIAVQITNVGLGQRDGTGGAEIGFIVQRHSSNTIGF